LEGEKEKKRDEEGAAFTTGESKAFPALIKTDVLSRRGRPSESLLKGIISKKGRAKE